MIRIAKLSDQEQINKLGKLINPDYEKLFILKDILDKEFEKIIVVEKENIVYGFIHINNIIDEAEIINLVVDPLFQRQGYGEKLLNYVIKNILINTKQITLEVASNNISALNFYQKNNFQIINTRKKYYGKKDGYTMIRWLK